MSVPSSYEQRLIETAEALAKFETSTIRIAYKTSDDMLSGELVVPHLTAYALDIISCYYFYHKLQIKFLENTERRDGWYKYRVENHAMYFGQRVYQVIAKYLNDLDSPSDYQKFVEEFCEIPREHFKIETVLNPEIFPNLKGVDTTEEAYDQENPNPCSCRKQIEYLSEEKILSRGCRGDGFVLHSWVDEKSLPFLVASDMKLFFIDINKSTGAFQVADQYVVYKPLTFEEMTDVVRSSRVRISYKSPADTVSVERDVDLITAILFMTNYEDYNVKILKNYTHITTRYNNSPTMITVINDNDPPTDNAEEFLNKLDRNVNFMKVDIRDLIRHEKDRKPYLLIDGIKRKINDISYVRKLPFDTQVFRFYYINSAQ